MSERAKTAFQNYLKAKSETKDCEEPCLKNGRSDRYCLECANEIMKPMLNKE